MNLYLRDIQKLNEEKCNNCIQKHWKITGEVSLSNEENATITSWKLYGGVGTEYNSSNHTNSLNVLLKNSDVFVINMDVLSSYNKFTPSEDREFSVEIYFKNSRNLRRKYIFTYYINNDEQFILKTTRLHLLQ